MTTSLKSWKNTVKRKYAHCILPTTTLVSDQRKGWWDLGLAIIKSGRSTIAPWREISQRWIICWGRNLHCCEPRMTVVVRLCTGRSPGFPKIFLPPIFSEYFCLPSPTLSNILNYSLDTGMCSGAMLSWQESFLTRWTDYTMHFIPATLLFSLLPHVACLKGW